MASDSHFDRAASWYDRVAGLVFGSSIRSLERSLLDKLEGRQSLVWIGGGTGEILPEIIRHYPELSIEYIEISSEMSERAKRRLGREEDHKVRFWHSFEAYSQESSNDDTLLLSCVMDVFDEEELQVTLSKWTSDRPTILAVDFIIPGKGPGRLLANFLIPMMYRFFQITIGLPAHSLPDWRQALRQCGYERKREIRAWAGIMEASVWTPSGI